MTKNDLTRIMNIKAQNKAHRSQLADIIGLDMHTADRHNLKKALSMLEEAEVAIRMAIAGISKEVEK